MYPEVPGKLPNVPAAAVVVTVIVPLALSKTGLVQACLALRKFISLSQHQNCSQALEHILPSNRLASAWQGRDRSLVWRSYQHTRARRYTWNQQD